jgi:G3E family GTPase
MTDSMANALNSIEDQIEWSRRIPVTIVGGHAGAGKTTLLNHLLAGKAGRRLAVILDEIGGREVNRRLLRTAGATAQRVGYARTAELVWALANLRSRPDPPDHIVIEASAVSDPRWLADAADLQELRLDAIVILADASAIRPHGADAAMRALRQQLVAADLIVLNQADRLTDLEREAEYDWISELIPTAHVVESSHARLPAALVLGEVREGPTSASAMDLTDLAAGERKYAWWEWSREQAFAGPSLRWWAANLPGTVLRGHGIVRLEEDPAYPYAFHHVGPRWTLVRDGPWRDEPALSRMTLIGQPRGLDPLWLDMAIDRCVAHHAAV